jgi:membrane protein implicated in regulation of membrane protease activity
MLLRSSARLLRRIVITIVGAAILALGAVLLVAPGPGFLVIALGLVVLGVEYEWARRRLDYVRQKVADLADLAVAKPWSTAGSVLAALGLIAAGIVVGVVHTLPASSWWTGGSLIAGGLIALATIVVSLVQARRARRAGRPTPGEELLREHEQQAQPPRPRDAEPAGSDAGGESLATERTPR